MAVDQNVVRLVLAELRCAYLRARMAELEIEQLSEVLKCGAIEPGDALIALEQMGWVGLLGPELRQMVLDGKPKHVNGSAADAG